MPSCRLQLTAIYFNSTQYVLTLETQMVNMEILFCYQDHCRLCKVTTRPWCLSNASKVNQDLEQSYTKLCFTFKKNPSFDIYYSGWPINKNNFLVRTTLFCQFPCLPIGKVSPCLNLQRCLLCHPQQHEAIIFLYLCSSTRSQADSHAGT